MRGLTVSYHPKWNMGNPLTSRWKGAYSEKTEGSPKPRKGPRGKLGKKRK